MLENADYFIPDNKTLKEALTRTTHMAIAAHQDDIEIMAYDGILKCFGNDENWFLAVVVTNGAGSPRDGIYASYSDDMMKKIRKQEQKKAAFTGEYSGVVFMDKTSPEVKDSKNNSIIEDLKSLILKTRPKIIYTHNLADRHDTHIGVAVKVIRVLRELSEEYQPEKLYGCEVWRNLDWLNDNEKVIFDVSDHQNIASAVVEVYDSQICGGKRYDLATMGRRLSNATYNASHKTDKASSIIYGMDLTLLIKDQTLNICTYISSLIDNFKADTVNRIKRII